MRGYQHFIEEKVSNLRVILSALLPRKLEAFPLHLVYTRKKIRLVNIPLTSFAATVASKVLYNLLKLQVEEYANEIEQLNASEPSSLEVIYEWKTGSQIGCRIIHICFIKLTNYSYVSIIQ